MGLAANAASAPCSGLRLTRRVIGAAGRRPAAGRKPLWWLYVASLCEKLHEFVAGRLTLKIDLAKLAGINGLRLETHARQRCEGRNTEHGVDRGPLSDTTCCQETAYRIAVRFIRRDDRTRWSLRFGRRPPLGEHADDRGARNGAALPGWRVA